jgi:hypothetical protein
MAATAEKPQGKKTGKGLYKYANGDVYDGEWKDGSMNGYGVYTSNDGGKYKGMCLLHNYVTY